MSEDGRRPGAVIVAPGSAREGARGPYSIAAWRRRRPVFRPPECIQCFLCWIFCPDSALRVEGGKVAGVDYEVCKGCGICARECPTRIRPPEARALDMVEEAADLSGLEPGVEMR